MAIPAKPLIIVNYDVDHLTLADNHLLFGNEVVYDDLYRFLLKYVDHENSWTRYEIGEIERSEVDELRTQLFGALADTKKTKPPEAPPLPAPEPTASGPG
jgi:hypothetical protein